MGHQKDLCMSASGKANQKYAGTTRVKKYKEPQIRVNICWEVRNEKKCVTLPKAEAYATRDWAEREGGVVFWFQPVN